MGQNKTNSRVRGRLILPSHYEIINVGYRMQFIDLKTQYQQIEDAIQTRIKGVLSHGQYILGPEVGELEQALSSYLGTIGSYGVSSGTDAILLALLALEVKPGDEVITSAFSFYATCEVIALLGAKPVFVDIDADTYNIDPDLIEAAITEKTKVIMPVGLYGQCADMDVINETAKKHGLKVIEDGAQSFGSTYKGRPSCTLADIACTSFFPAKPLGGYGDSGACFTHDEVVGKRLKQLSNHGQNVRYKHHLIGTNARMDTLQAAVLLEKLKIFPSEIEKRQVIAKRYQHLLEGVVKTPFIASYNTSSFAQYTIEVKDRDNVANQLKMENIPTAVHYPIPLPFQPAMEYLGYQKGDFPVAEHACQHVLSLPMSPYLTEKDQNRVAAELKKAIV